MPAFLDRLFNMGAAHLQHVQAIRAALQIANTQEARNQLASYLKGLSDASLMGFRVSVSALLGAEQNAQVRQALQWVLANIEGLRQGKFAPVTPQALPPHGLTLEQVASLIEPWAELTPQRAQEQFVETMTALDAQGRQEFAAHCEVLAAHVQQRLQQLQENESSAWGTSFEDRMAYMQARLQTGQSDPAHAGAVAEQQAILDGLVQMAQAARAWREPDRSPPVSTQPATSKQEDRMDLSDFPTGGTRSEQMAFMNELLEKQKDQMDPARAAALADFVDQMTEYLRAEEERQAENPVDSNDRAALEADLRERMRHVAGMRERMEHFRDMHRDVRRQEPPAVGTRASEVRPYVAALIDDVAGQRTSHVVSIRKSESQKLEELHMQLISARARLDELGANDDQVLNFEVDTLRATAQALRLFHRRGHATIARPVWPGGAARVEPSTALFAGPQGLRSIVESCCRGRRLMLCEDRQAGVDQATWLWRSMQRAGIAVVDLSDGDPQVYYQLGQAYALGTEILLIAREGTNIPFDVAQFILYYPNEASLAAQLPPAVDAVVYGVQTHGLSALMHSTLQHCRDLAEKATGSQQHAGVLLSQLEATVHEPIDFRAALEQFLGQMGNTRLVLLHPRWPAHYPAEGQKRCFVVMPFSERLAATQSMYRRIDADLSAGGVEVVRGDEGEGQEIVASIWDETARASHVLVDLTQYNLNVCLELGMADALGRPSLLIGANGTSDGRFAAIDKRRIHHYGEDDASQGAVLRQVHAFVNRANTPR